MAEAWNTESNQNIPRAEAINAITAKAREEGISGSFKVYYNGQLVSNPNELPETVNMGWVRVSAMFDNA